MIGTLFAFLWIFVSLEVWSPKEVNLIEAIVLVLMFPVVVLTGFIMHKVFNRTRSVKVSNEDTLLYNTTTLGTDFKPEEFIEILEKERERKKEPDDFDDEPRAAPYLKDAFKVTNLS
jgi:hypothetical protein